MMHLASKFGLRGAAHALRENLRRDRISATCINLGDIATAIPYEDGVEKAVAASSSHSSRERNCPSHGTAKANRSQQKCR